jgi:hypothetical protein
MGQRRPATIFARQNFQHHHFEQQAFHAGDAVLARRQVEERARRCTTLMWPSPVLHAFGREGKRARDGNNQCKVLASGTGDDFETPGNKRIRDSESNNSKFRDLS